ncbi:MAG: helix-turn-helix transcriptional regulator [Roseibium sp.]
MARPESQPKTPIASRLRDVRRNLGDPDRSELAKTLGVSKTTVASYERGESEPTASVLAAYRSNYGIDIGWLLTGSGEMFADPSKAPTAKDIRAINTEVFRQIGRLVTKVYKEESVKLPPDALLDEQSAAYNALIERAEDPGDTQELLSLLPWLESRLKKNLTANRKSPGSGKHQA